MTEIVFDREGTRLFGVEAGGGLPIVLLHGGMADHRACWVYATPLAGGLRVITPDLRGAGRSRHAGALDWDLLADDVAALLRHLGLARAVIGGSSFGSACALRVALRHPRLVEQLVLVHPAYAGADRGLTEAQRAAMDAMAAAGERALAEGIAALHPLFDRLPDGVRARARAMVDSFDPASVAATTRFMASGAQPFAAAAELAAVAAPALIVPGVDETHPAWIAELYARHIPDSRLVATSDLAAAIAAFVTPEPAGPAPRPAGR